MWIMLNDSFLSIVRKNPSDDFLTVRSRARGDIERVFPGATVTNSGGTDYAFRARIPADVVAKAIAERIASIDYGNFKSSVADNDRHDAYIGCWNAMMRFQIRREGKPGDPRQLSF